MDKCVLGTGDYSNVHSEGTSLFTQTFPDTVVTFKTNPIPVRAKKAKPDLDLGVKPLENTVQKSLILDYKIPSESAKLPRVTSTVTRPTTSSMMMWETAGQSVDGVQHDTGEKKGHES